MKTWIGLLLAVAAVVEFDRAAPPIEDRSGGRGVWVIESFEGTLADAAWRSGPSDQIVPEGGNTDAYLHTGAIESEAPSLAALPGTPFVGSYRFLGVAELGLDIRLTAASAGDGRPVSLELTSGECRVVQVGKRLSAAEGAWQAYTFKVPAYLTRLPSGWSVRSDCGGLSPDEVWDRVMGGWSQARFVLGDPDLGYPLEPWQVGFDNPRIRIGGKGGSGPALAQ